MVDREGKTTLSCQILPAEPGSAEQAEVNPVPPHFAGGAAHRRSGDARCLAGEIGSFSTAPTFGRV